MTTPPLHDSNKLPPATISEDEGVRYLHLGTSWIQGAMRLSKPNAIELEYVQNMMAWLLFVDQPAHIAQLGLGCGALSKFSYHHFPDTHITAVELNPAVIETARTHFLLPSNNGRFNVLQMDAQDFVHNTANHGTLDVLQIDLYDENADGPVFDSPEFYQACADCLSDTGIMTTNLFGNFGCHEKNIDAIQEAFDATAWLPPVDDENMIAIAFKQAPSIDFGDLFRRAAYIRKTTGLYAKSWVIGLQNWMREQT